MSQVIAFAGKGGTGKTTTAALFIHQLIEHDKKPVLAVDADPNTNLGEALGIADIRTIGMAREEFFGERAKVPAGMPKEAFLEMKLNETLIETKDFDLMVMGRQEGPGCYCYLNNILRHFIDQMVGAYPFTIIDNEAGMEHLSRRTTRNIDHLALVSDYSIKGLRAGHRILQLIEELDLTVKNKHLIITRAPLKVDAAFQEKMDELGIVPLGFVPDDETVRDFDIHQKSFLELPADNPALVEIGRMVKKLLA